MWIYPSWHSAEPALPYGYGASIPGPYTCPWSVGRSKTSYTEQCSSHDQWLQQSLVRSMLPIYLTVLLLHTFMHLSSVLSFHLWRLQTQSPFKHLLQCNQSNRSRVLACWGSLPSICRLGSFTRATEPKLSTNVHCRYVLKNAVRDWAVEGSEERSQSYGRICDEISELLPDTSAEILVPGCGLGRLPFELSHLGHHVEAST